ncbi:MAG: LuxR C-terminal-related transcriptional regulator [Chloroflexi bacterium]|nr:LuxR C-terminal-related transcriptional regulator [Chloroflexota bacterium]MCC6894596.1 hypothetical protein [Anaerolineae bacterium]
MSKSWNAFDTSSVPLDPLTAREKDVLRLIVAGLSNSEIALQLFLSEGTVKWHNKNIFDKLDVRRRSEAIAKTHDLRLLQETFTPLATASKSNLPAQPTPFVGREAELDSIIARLNDPDCRLVTLAGMGGIGKTRLAICAAELAQPHFKQGVYFVPLEPVSAPDQVIGAVAQACRLPVSGAGKPLQQLLDFLQHKKLLLLLDNFEHLLDAQTDLLTILRHAPDVKILATSRIPLNLHEEWLIPVSGMAFPDRQAIESLDEFDAIRLFKLCATRAGIKLAAESNADIQHICQLTQGMPLAIELAAALLRTFTSREIIQHLSTDVNSIAAPLRNMPERHHSIQRVFEQSWSLLSSGDQRILRALSIFRGGFTSAALRDVTGASLNVLIRLVDYSFIHVTGEGRYDLHPLIQQILYEQLQTSGELENISDAHAAVFARYMQTWLPWLKGGQQTRAIGEIEMNIENIRSAWSWAIKCRDYTILNKMWEILHVYVEIAVRDQLVDFLLKSINDLNISTTPENEVQTYLLYLQTTLSETPEESLNSARNTLRFAEYFPDNIRAKAFALRSLGQVIDDDVEAIDWLEQSLALFRQINELYYVEMLLHETSFIYSLLGNKDEDVRCQEERYRICLQIDDRINLVSCLHQLASQELARGNYKAAESLGEEAYTIAQEFGNWRMTVIVPARMGFLCFLRGDFKSAETYFKNAVKSGEYAGTYYTRIFSMMFGYLANTSGDFAKADTIFAKALRSDLPVNPFLKLFADWGKAITKCGLHLYTSAATFLKEALNFAIMSENIAFISLSLPPAALILWHYGGKTRAVECLALWFTHPATQPQWFLKSVLGKDIFERMKADLGETAYDQAWQAGTTRDLKTTSAELLEFFTHKPFPNPPPTILTASSLKRLATSPLKRDQMFTLSTSICATLYLYFVSLCLGVFVLNTSLYFLGALGDSYSPSVLKSLRLLPPCAFAFCYSSLHFLGALGDLAVQSPLSFLETCNYCRRQAPSHPPNRCQRWYYGSNPLKGCQFSGCSRASRRHKIATRRI